YFTDHEPDLGRLVTEGRRREFASFSAFAGHLELIPDPQDEATFRRSKVDLDEREREGHVGVYSLYRDLLRLRREDPALRRQDRLAVETTVLGRRAMAFSLDNGARLVAANFGTRWLDRGCDRRTGKLILSTDEASYGGSSRLASLGDGRLRLPPE